MFAGGSYGEFFTKVTMWRNLPETNRKFAPENEGLWGCPSDLWEFTWDLWDEINSKFAPENGWLVQKIHLWDSLFSAFSTRFWSFQVKNPNLPNASPALLGVVFLSFFGHWASLFSGEGSLGGTLHQVVRAHVEPSKGFWFIIPKNMAGYFLGWGGLWPLRLPLRLRVEVRKMGSHFPPRMFFG